MYKGLRYMYTLALYRPYAHDVTRHYVISERREDAILSGKRTVASSLVHGERITRHCAVRCTNRFHKGCGLPFYRFPVDPDRLSRWLAAVKRENWQPNGEFMGVQLWVIHRSWQHIQLFIVPLLCLCIQVLLVVLRILPLAHHHRRVVHA